MVFEDVQDDEDLLGVVIPDPALRCAPLMQVLVNVEGVRALEMILAHDKTDSTLRRSFLILCLVQ